MNTNIRRKAIKWWNSQLGKQYQLMVIHKDKILEAVNRHPSSLTGREIEVLYKAETK
jgi:hypothetical protein